MDFAVFRTVLRDSHEDALRMGTDHGKFDKVCRVEKYIGIFQYGDIEAEGCVPRIISDELFYRVADIMEKNKQNQEKN